MLVGFYEQGCKTWGMDGIDEGFANALCPDDLDRITDVLEGAFARMPALMDVGIHTVVNGPITYSIDGAPLVGPIPGKRNAFCIIGLRAGLGEGGGHGWLLAQQIVHGEACYDTWVLDPRRFTGHANVELCAVKAIEEYQNEFRFHFPHEHRPAGRPGKTTPLTPVLEAEGGAFDPVNGWERLAYVKPTPDFVEEHAFHFTNVFDVVKAEIEHVRDVVGITEVNGFNRFELTGADVYNFLDRMTCGRIPTREGKVGLAYLLNHQGMIKAEATIANLSGGRVWYGSAAASEFHDMDWLQSHIGPGEDVHIRSLTNEWGILIVAGPRARDVMATVSRADWSAEAFPWLSARECFIGITPAVVMGVSFSGELAYEIHVPLNQIYSAYRSLRAAGDPLGMRLFGSRAVESMRLEKGFLHWKSDLITEFDPFETGLDRFVKMDKGNFVGREALASRPAQHRTLVTLAIETSRAPAHPGASVQVGERVVGTVTSGDWGHRTGLNLAYAFVDSDSQDQPLEIDICGQIVPAKIIPASPYDPSHSRMRA